MKSILFILLFFQVSLYAQTNDKKATPDAPYTALNGKTFERKSLNETDGGLKVTMKEIINGTITLKPAATGDTVPKIKSLEVFIPGYPAINIEGNKFDQATIDKARTIKKGDIIVVRAIAESGKMPAVLPLEITN